MWRNASCLEEEVPPPVSLALRLGEQGRVLTVWRFVWRVDSESASSGGGGTSLDLIDHRSSC